MDINSAQGDLLSKPLATPALAPEVVQLQSQVRTLQTLLTVTLASLIVLGGGLTVFLWKQTRGARAQMENLRAEVANTYTGFVQRGDPLVRSFIARLQLYAATNRDFAQVLEKYRTPLSPYFTGAPPAPAPAPNAVPGTPPPAKR